MIKKFNISNMSCVVCSTTIETHINKLNGIKKAEVNLLKKEMIVDYDDSVISEDKIISEVKKLGYGASLTKKEENPFRKLLISICLLVPLMYLSNAKMFNLPTFDSFYVNSFICLGLTIAISIINIHYFINGFKGLFKLSPNMDTLIATSSLAAIIYGVLIILFKLFNVNISTEVDTFYFESAGMVITLISIGKFLEARAKLKTTNELNSLLDLTPKTALVLRNGIEFEVNSSELTKGDVVVIRSGDIIPIDGVILEGGASLDESILTGEAMLIDKTEGDLVYKATSCKSGYIKIKATTASTETKYDELVKLVEEASKSKAPIAKLADIICKFFVPTVMALSLLTFIIWMIIKQDVSFAITLAISVLVASCPCALGLATPTAIMVSTGVAAKNAILVSNAESLEHLSSVNTVIFDKTGTLTKGELIISQINPFQITRDEFLALVSAIESHSKHPISKNLSKLVENHGLIVEEFEDVFGYGIKGKIDGKAILAGNIKLLEKENIEVIDELKNIKEKAVYFAYDDNFIGYITLKDTLKESTTLAINTLKKMKYNIGIISGDNEYQTKEIAEKLGITDYYYEVLPSDKDKIVTKYQEEGKNVAFVGDGVNDSIALQKANVGIAIGSGTNVAIENANLVLSRSDLNDLVSAILLSKKTMRIIKENLFWAFFYNIILIPIAMGILTPFGFYMRPFYGAIAMCISSLFVVTNALRLRKFAVNKELNKIEEENEMKKENINVVINVEGMMCPHCEKRVVEALLKVKGVVNVVADHYNNKVTVTIKDESLSFKLKNAIEEAGYKVF